VLVVDDDAVIRKLLELNFQMEGLAVLSAHDAAEAVDMARAQRPDIVIADVMMPERSGLELVEDLKGDPDTRDIPIVVLSAKAQTIDVRLGIDAGADEYVTKPFERLELVDLVNDLLTRSAPPAR
jgi:DNA-binding response OmpR family regulator